MCKIIHAFALRLYKLVTIVKLFLFLVGKSGAGIEFKVNYVSILHQIISSLLLVLASRLVQKQIKLVKLWEDNFCSIILAF